MEHSTANGIGGAGSPLEAGGAGPPSSGSASVGRRRAFGLGAGRAAVAGVSALAVLSVALLLAHGRSRTAVPAPAVHSASSYGGLPSWLPKPKLKVDRLLHASPTHPVLSIEGEAVSVDLGSARVLATAVGPEVPEEGRFPVPPVTPCTFIVTFASASHAIPLGGSTFALIDEHGGVHHPKVTALDGGAPPDQIAPGHPLSVRLHDILPTGDGGLSWSPEGRRPIVTWDYTVEID